IIRRHTPGPMVEPWLELSVSGRLLYRRVQPRPSPLVYGTTLCGGIPACSTGGSCNTVRITYSHPRRIHLRMLGRQEIDDSPQPIPDIASYLPKRLLDPPPSSRLALWRMQCLTFEDIAARRGSQVVIWCSRLTRRIFHGHRLRRPDDRSGESRQEFNCEERIDCPFRYQEHAHIMPRGLARHQAHAAPDSSRDTTSTSASGPSSPREVGAA